MLELKFAGDMLHLMFWNRMMMTTKPSVTGDNETGDIENDNETIGNDAGDNLVTADNENRMIESKQ